MPGAMLIVVAGQRKWYWPARRRRAARTGLAVSRERRARGRARSGSGTSGARWSRYASGLTSMTLLNPGWASGSGSTRGSSRSRPSSSPRSATRDGSGSGSASTSSPLSRDDRGEVASESIERRRLGIRVYEDERPPRVDRRRARARALGSKPGSRSARGARRSVPSRSYVHAWYGHCSVSRQPRPSTTR